MNRKDLIVVGVVANVALTLALFLSAGRPSRSAQDLVAGIPRGVETIAPTIQAPAVTLKPLAQKVAEEQREKPAAIEAPKQVLRQAVVAAEKVEVKQAAIAEEKPVMQQVVVRAGDVLEKIARQYHSSVEEIRKANHLVDDRLQIGQLLQVPLLAKSAKKQEAKVIDPNGKYYTVRPGESPWIIAAKHQMKVEELLRLNQLDEDKAKKIKAGDTLRIA